VLAFLATVFMGRFYIEMAKVALGLYEFSHYTITVLPEKTELLINGYVAFGLTDELRDRVRDLPKLWLIHLNSDGGWILEARKMKDLIKERQLSTYTEAGCNSACTIAFLAGKKRILHVNARMGFHQSEVPGLPSFFSQQEDKVDKQDFLDAGIRQEFVRKAFSTPYDDMWFPSTDELVEAGVVTHTFDGTQIIDQRHGKVVDELLKKTKPH
jgi:hypothetical protein